jgi:hypothetical protein
VAGEPALHPAAGAARRDGPPEGERARVAQERLDSREQGAALAAGCGRRLDLADDRLAVERPADQRIEVGERVEAPVRPERVLPLVEPDGVAVPAVGGVPGLEDGGLRVDDEAVEVEDDGGDRAQRRPSGQPRAAAIFATRALIRS